MSDRILETDVQLIHLIPGIILIIQQYRCNRYRKYDLDHTIMTKISMFCFSMKVKLNVNMKLKLIIFI